MVNKCDKESFASLISLKRTANLRKNKIFTSTQNIEHINRYTTDSKSKKRELKHIISSLHFF